jgi:hypothetical protein
LASAAPQNQPRLNPSSIAASAPRHRRGALGLVRLRRAGVRAKRGVLRAAGQDFASRADDERLAGDRVAHTPRATPPRRNAVRWTSVTTITSRGPAPDAVREDAAERVRHGSAGEPPRARRAQRLAIDRIAPVAPALGRRAEFSAPRPR